MLSDGLRDPLVDHQFRLLGRDVEHPGGNLLMRAGFVREPAPQGRGVTRYRLRRASLTVVVWPFAMLVGRCLLPRVDGAAAWRGAPPDLRHPQELRALLEDLDPCRPAPLARTMAWLAGWERWVEASVGLAHRAAPLGPASAAPAGGLALYGEWEQRAAALRRSRTSCERRWHRQSAGTMTPERRRPQDSR
jgi:hypothetical protein